MDAITPEGSRHAADAQETADVVIIGGGASGCVIASRLSEDASLRVLLLEAGRDTPEGATPSDVTDVFPRAYANPAYFWPGLTAVPRPGFDPIPFSQARILGGGSSVMGMWALRGVPADFDTWGAAAPGWSYADVLPYFRKMERDIDFPTSDQHGDAGLVPVLRRKRSTWPRFTEVLARAAERRGYPFLPDLNATSDDGVFEMPFSTNGSVRTSSASAYLTAAVRRRPNLRVMTDTEVTAINFDGLKAVGLRARRPDGQSFTVAAPRIVVSAGAIYSPTLLLRSGIGPASELSARGITPLVDNADVGRHLQNHIFIHLGSVVKPEARHDPAMRNYALGCLRASSGHEGAPPSDLFLSFLSRSGPRDRDNTMGMIAVSLYSPFSRGVVRVDGKTGKPDIHLGLLEDARDKARIITGAKLARDLLLDDEVKRTIHEIILMPAKLPIRLLNQPGLKSDLYSLIAAGLIDLGGWSRRSALSYGLGSGRRLDEMKNEKAFEDLVVSSATSMFHPAGTCALGKVVNSDTSVKGTEGLFVADASIMPKVPRANTNIPTVMLAEKAAVEISATIKTR